MQITSEAKTLYLEDEPLIALDVMDALEDIGIPNVHSVRTLKKARAAVETETFDFAILDVNLGNGENSFEFARELMKSGTQILFVSGYNSNEFPEDLRHIRVLSKPFDPRTLARAIAEA